MNSITDHRLEARLAVLESQIQALSDISAIKSLKYRYLRACDLKQPEIIRGCFDSDGATIAYEGFPPFTNRDDFVAIYQQMACKPSIIDMHHAHNPEITLTGPNTATGTWDLYFNNIDTEAGTILQMACLYTDRYTRKQGSWWITSTATKRTSFLMQKKQPDGTLQVLTMGEAPNTPFGS